MPMNPPQDSPASQPTPPQIPDPDTVPSQVIDSSVSEHSNQNGLQPAEPSPPPSQTFATTQEGANVSKNGTVKPPAGASTKVERQGSLQSVAGKSPSTSRKGSTPSDPVPEPQRPALVHRWIDNGVLLPNLQNPRSYTQRQKAIIVTVVAVASFCGPFTSNILMPSFPFLGPSLRLSPTEVTLTTTMFLVATGVGPLFHAYLSQKVGRRPVYICGFVLFAIASIACASAPDGDDLIAYRFFQAFGCSVAQSIGMGTIADIYIPSERGRATGWWYLGPILGPMVSPLVGGGIYQRLGWRAVLWATVIFGFVLLAAIVLLVPETSLAIKERQAASLNAPIPLPTNAPTPSQRSTSTHASRAVSFFTRLFKSLFEFLVRPWEALWYLLFPPIGLTALFCAIAFAALYGLSTVTPFTFSEPPYNLETINISFTYLPTCFGYILGSVGGGYLSDRELRLAKERLGDACPPESRLRSARWGVPLIPIGLCMFGWSVQKFQHIALACVGGFLFGLGFLLANGTIMAYFADVIPGQAASIVAAYNVGRNVLAGLVAAITSPAVREMGEGWYLTILAVLCLFSAVNLVTVQRLGPYWRRKRLERIEAQQAAANAAST